MNSSDKILLGRLCEACQKSEHFNRFAWLKARTPFEMLKEFKAEPIYKIVYSAFFIGSKYEVRRENLEPAWDGIKRPSYFGNVTENGVIRYLLSNPEKIYIWVWKAEEKEYRKKYVDFSGNVITDFENEILPKIRKQKKSEIPQRIYKLENVFEVSVNGETFIDKELSAIYDRYVI